MNQEELEVVDKLIIMRLNQIHDSKLAQINPLIDEKRVLRNHETSIEQYKEDITQGVHPKNTTISLKNGGRRTD